MTRAQPLSVADKLDEARALIERGWIQGSLRDGVCVCALGAINRIQQDSTIFVEEAYDLIADAVGEPRKHFSLVAWNDAPERTQAEVVEAFKKAAALARAEA